MNNQEELFNTFSDEEKERLSALFDRYRLSVNERKEIIAMEADMRMWRTGSILTFLDTEKIEKVSSGQRAKAVMTALRKAFASFTQNAALDAEGEKAISVRKELVIKNAPSTLLGKCPCPVDGEKTRCCKLVTLDAIMGCPFGCAYCSIASFYDKGAITIPNDLDERLDKLELDPSVWHIGTGQSSDSLVFSDDYKTLSALSAFAKKHPDVVLEMKTKSSRTDFLSLDLPKNIIFTWSVNADSVIRREEHFTATLKERIKAARAVSDKGYLVGFHIHPIMYFKNWEEEYHQVVSLITSAFRPEELILIGMGTLTFTKANLQRLRMEGKETQVLRLPLTPAAGKFSYPLETKKEFFSRVYSFFPEEYKKEVFFYLCMEDPSLWLPVLGREYGSDAEFESDMKASYFRKIRSVSSLKA